MTETVNIAISTPWLIFALILVGISAIFMFLPRTPACVTAYMAMWAARFSGFSANNLLSDGTMIFWGVAVVIVVANHLLIPAFVRNSSRGVGYIAGGALVGMALGLCLYRPATIVGGAIVFAFLAAIAYTRTKAGASLEFPTSKFFNYLGAKAIPAVIAASMIGLVFAGIIASSFYG